MYSVKIVLITLFILWIHGRVSGVHSSWAETLTVYADGPISSISRAIDAARPGSTIEVHGGVYSEQIIINKAVSIIGYGTPHIMGDGKGTVVTITSPGTVFKGFKVTGSGSSLSIEHGGIVLDNAPGCVIENNILEDVLFGIYFKNSPDGIIKNNKIVGKDLPLPERGDGIRLWYSSGTKILNNHLIATRDLVMWWSGDTLIKGNRIERGRYGLHYMYSNDNLFEDNVFIDNYVGGFLMYSRNIVFRNNIFARNQGPATGYGVGFKDLDSIKAERNVFIDNRIGLYLDNSPNAMDSWNELSENVIAFNDIGASFMPSIERNIFVSNSFIDNSEQIEVRGGGRLSGNEWSDKGKGNYWSDYIGYDGDGDGVGEIPYHSDSLFESLVDEDPNLRIFHFSPAANVIELASEAFPVMKPEPKVTDDYPLVKDTVPGEYKTSNTAFRTDLFGASLFLIMLPVVTYVFIRRLL